jgi:hypothetical protein
MSGTNMPFFIRVFFLVFPICHVALGVGLTYLCLAGFVNRTVLSVEGGNLRVWQGPLPWSGNHQWPVQDVRQLYVRHRARSRNADSPATFEVVVVSADGRQRALLRSPLDQDQALFLEQEIERFLNLPDQPIRGEIPKT